ncbi:translation elongation factor-like protein [candidate division WWE3 bacterium CG08_land_8_20_14_0_20_43_13]|uniref:Translation elongation factor-like protein n=1 Tax=candidate division WWE3 bacterium CG08_land_8_20_14_0_20_43_13 TaxID=1975087 RepID=A0A2H0X8E4_UNCKA|nr:MAG: translation elongation factor-like protein [candidate division WWE3 bacterium CG08_land_8_20_14_0_20_43_13]
MGQITHYFDKIGVATIKLEAELAVDDNIRIGSPTASVEQTVESMQINHEPVSQANVGEEIGLKVKEPVREGDSVYLIKE